MYRFTFSELPSVFIFLAYFQTTGAGSMTNCPIGWFHYDTSCFLFSSYELNWFDAESSCRAHDSRLAEVYTRSVGDFLSVTASTYAHDFWLGGRDDIIEGRWQWASTGTSFTVTNWAPHEPNDGKNHDQDCLQIYHKAGYKWDDDNCAHMKRFICESKFSGSIWNPIG